MDMTHPNNDSGSIAATAATSVTKMHADEIDTSAALVRQLLAEQFPQWANLSVTPVPSSGTDNAMFRLGDDLAVRMPRIPGAAGQVAKEQMWLPRLPPAPAGQLRSNCQGHSHGSDVREHPALAAGGASERRLRVTCHY